MKVEAVLLCDAATIREGLLHILGGGITRVGREDYPAALGIALALRIGVHPTEVLREHELRVLLQHEHGQEVLTGMMTFIPNEPTDELFPGEELSLPLTVPFQPAPIPAPGGYTFEIFIDGVHQTSIPFRAVIAKEDSG